MVSNNLLAKVENLEIEVVKLEAYTRRRRLIKVKFVNTGLSSSHRCLQNLN